MPSNATSTLHIPTTIIGKNLTAMKKQNYLRIQIILLALFCYVSSVFAIDYTYQNGTGVSCAWSSTDVIGFYTPESTLIRSKVSSYDSKDALFSMLGWELSQNYDYTGFAPYYRYPSGTSTSQLPVSFANQSQTANNSLTHLTAYDFMATKGRSTSTNAEFTFSHLASILRIEWTMSEAATLTSLTLSSNNSIFTTDAYLNLTTQSLVPKTKSTEYKLNLSNITIAKSGTLIAYLMIAPTDCSSETLTFTLQTTEGKTITAEMNGCNILAGKTYPITINGGAVTPPKNTSKIVSRTVRKVLGASSLAYPLAHITDFPIDTTNKFAQPLVGDANGDGKLTLYDVAIIISYLNKENPLHFNMKGADITNDGKIDKSDINAIKELLLNK